jgi:ADP-ribose pyrophosphatase YjhB (NUDIX family)
MDYHKEFVIRSRAVILLDGKLLAVRHAYDDSFFALPGGRLEWGEEVKECLQREIIEELGVKPEIGRLLYVHTFLKRESFHSIEFFFEVINAEAYRETSALSGTHTYELAAIEWVSPTDEVTLLPRSFAKDFKEGKLFSDDVRYSKDDL